MTAPVWRHNISGVEFHAVQFKQDDPTTHWHVNFGHPAAKALSDKYWARTLDGPQEVADKDWIVRIAIANSDYVKVVAPKNFESDYTFVREAPLGKADLKKLKDAQG